MLGLFVQEIMGREADRQYEQGRMECMWGVGNREQRTENGESSMGNRDSGLGAGSRKVKSILVECVYCEWSCFYDE